MNENFTERIVAFIDILGFKDLVEQSMKSEEIAKRLHRALELIYEHKEENESDDFVCMQQYGIEVSVFSDSAIISYPMDYEGGLFFILLDIIHLQLDLACLGILIRGGIAIGPMYHRGQIAYGPAMNRAYFLESEYAKMPRIVVEEETIREGIVKTCASRHTVQMEAEYVQSCVKQASDGFYFLDMLRQGDELTDFGDEYYYWLIEVRKIIVKGLNENVDKKRVYRKYLWLKKYFNEVVTDPEAFYPVPQFDVDGRKFRKAYAELKIKRRKHQGDEYC